MKARDYKAEYQYHGTPEQIKRRAQRNAARAKMEKSVGTKAISGKDIHHRSGMSNALSNLSVRSKSANRADH